MVFETIAPPLFRAPSNSAQLKLLGVWLIALFITGDMHPVLRSLGLEESEASPRLALLTTAT